MEMPVQLIILTIPSLIYLAVHRRREARGSSQCWLAVAADGLLVVGAERFAAAGRRGLAGHAICARRHSATSQCERVRLRRPDAGVGRLPVYSGPRRD
jgi:hypothetical protein